MPARVVRSERRVEAPELGAHFSNVALVHTRLRLHAVHNARVVSEDLLLARAYPRTGGVDRPVATVLLEGRARLTVEGRHVWLSPGDGALVRSKGAIHMRQEGDPYAAVALEWDADWLGRPPELVRALSCRLERVRDAWQLARHGGDAAEAAARLVDELRRGGAPALRVTPAELAEPVPERMQELTAALDAALSRLGEQPMMLDLEGRLGLSSRQLNRLVAAYHERYAFNATGWIDARNRRRLLLGAAFMTAPGATTKYVAGVVGYRSAAAFARALRDARLPPAGRIAGEVRKIAEETGG